MTKKQKRKYKKKTKQSKVEKLEKEIVDLKVKLHTDKYLHLPKMIGLAILAPIYVPIWWVILIGAAIGEGIFKVVLLVACLIGGLFSKDLFGFTYKPSWKKVTSWFEFFKWFDN